MVELADKAVEAGIQEVWELLSSGRLKVFDSCSQWFEEVRLYRRDDKGRIVKQHDHLMDCTRYLVRARHERMKTKQPEKSADDYEDPSDRINKSDCRSANREPTFRAGNPERLLEVGLALNGERPYCSRLFHTQDELLAWAEEERVRNQVE